MNFSDKIASVFEASSEIMIYKKGDFLLTEGQVENYIYFIVDGAVKLCYISEHHHKIIRLGYTGSYINSLSSFLNGKPSEFCIEAIRKTEVKRISKEAIQTLAKESSDYSKFLENLLVNQIDREIDLLTDSPAVRLQRVLERSPEVFQYVPLKYIASYLRMNPETLSRIRNS